MTMDDIKFTGRGRGEIKSAHGRFNFRLPYQLKLDFLIACKIRDVVAGDVLKKYIASYVEVNKKAIDEYNFKYRE
jgi:hypothetical protein